MKNTNKILSTILAGTLTAGAIAYNSKSSFENPHQCEGLTPNQCIEQYPSNTLPESMREFEDEIAPRTDGKTIFDDWQDEIRGVVNTEYNISEALRFTGAPFFYEVNKAGHECNFSVGLAYAVMKQESNFDPQATSRTGAQGLMQLTSGTAAYMGVNDRNNIEENIKGGVCYLARLRDQYKIEDVDLLLASYNAGPGAVRRAPGDTFEEKKGNMGSQADVFVPLVRGTLEGITRASQQQPVDRTVIDQAHKQTYNQITN